MSERLKLELSAEKTLITNAQDKAKFLGYEIYARKSDVAMSYKKGVLSRNYNARIILELPREAVKKKLLEYGAMTVKEGISPNGKWTPTPRRNLTNLEPEKILALVNGEFLQDAWYEISFVYKSDKQKIPQR